MPKKLINTLKYGSGKTKRKIYLMMGILAAGVVLTLLAVIFGNVLMGLAAFLVMFIDGLILFNTNFEQKTVSVNRPEKPEKETSLAHYDEQKLKKLFVAYKVKKHHVPVLVDLCSAERIVQRPTYMWNDSSYLYFLVLDAEPRLLKSKLSESDCIHIRRGMSARPVEEYPELNDKSVISMIFSGLLPKYYTVEINPYRTEHRKNMYSAAPGIWCSSGSVKNILKILPDNFVLDDGKTDGESVYYQKIYIARVMFYDGIYSAQEYKEKVLEVLGELIRAEIAESVVTEYLNSMMSNGLIPREYADYVIAKRKAR